MSAILEQPTIDASPAPEAALYRISTDEFYRMLEAEVFPDEARLELWNGWIYEKMAKTQAHVVSGNKTQIVLSRVLPPAYFVGGENPITVGPARAPLPDLVVLRGIPDDYLDRRPVAADVGLVVELSLTSLKSDVGSKLGAYARAGIPAYWVVNLIDGVVLVHSNPVPPEGRYASVATVKPGESFPFLLDGVQVALIAASDLLPAR